MNCTCDDKHPFFAYGSRRHRHAVPGEPALRVTGLTVGYDRNAAPCLTDATLTARVGQRIALVGANGAGKSTLLKAVAGLLKPTSGQIAIFGNPVGACHHRVAYLPQRSDLDWQFPIDVKQLVMAGRYMHLGYFKWPRRKDRQIVQQTLDRLQIADLAHKQIAQLSGGQQQRVLLARALVQQARLILLDEPTNAVDNDTRQTIESVIVELAQNGCCVITATHDLSTLHRCYDRVIHLHKTRIVSDTTPQEHADRLHDHNLIPDDQTANHLGGVA
jgi:manganese/zinc/iron transport system ATP- binding protein